MRQRVLTVSERVPVRVLDGRVRDVLQVDDEQDDLIVLVLDRSDQGRTQKLCS